MLKINGKVVKDVVYNGKRIERIMVGSKKYYDMYDGRISGYAIEAGSISYAGKTYSYNAGYFDIYIGEAGSGLSRFFYQNKMGTLTHIGLDTRHVTDMNGMFGNCSSLTTVDLSHFDTGNVTNMNQMFGKCSSLTTLDLSHFDTGNVTDMNQMFYQCSSLTTLDLSHFDTGNVTNMNSMFYNCSKLKIINVGNMDLSGLITISNTTFQICSSLTTITGNFFGLKASISFGSCPLDHDSAMMVINSAEPVTTAKIISFSSYTKALLSDEEKAVATNKGWTIA